MHNPPGFKYYTPLLTAAAKDVCRDNMKAAVEECVEENDGIRNITAIFDGSWQWLGHSLLNGVAAAIGDRCEDAYKIL